MCVMDTNNIKPQHTYCRRRKTLPIPFGEPIDKYVSEALSGSKGFAEEVVAFAADGRTFAVSTGELPL